MDKQDAQLTEDHRQMWTRLEAELDPLLIAGAAEQVEQRLTAMLATVGADAQSSGLRARLLGRRAECWLDLDDGQAALSDARQALELGYETAEILGLAGWASYHLDRPGRARDYFDRALAKESGDLTLLTGRALALVELEEYDQARVDLTRALRRDGDRPDLLGLRGEVYMHLGDLEQAGADLQAAVDAAPNDPEYALTLGRLWVVRGDVEKAVAVVEDAVEQAVDEGGEFGLEALLLRSYLHLLAGHQDAARADAIRASNLYADEAFSFVQLAHVQLTAGKLGLAQKAAQRAVLLDPSLSDAYLVRGASRQMAGDAEGAKEDFERASRAAAELPLFLLGPAAQVADGQSLGFDEAIFDLLRDDEQANPFGSGFDPSAFADAFGSGGGAGMGQMGNMNPMSMLDRIFDDSGNIRGPLKPFFDMAFKNAPKIMENMPDGMFSGVDKEELEQFDFSNLSSDEIEARMREFYQTVKSGQSPFEDGDEGQERGSEGDATEADDLDAPDGDDQDKPDHSP